MEKELSSLLRISEDGKTVLGVKDKTITSIIIPNGVTSIGERAFGDYINLEKIVIQDSVTDIGDGAFAYCNFKEIKFPKHLKKIGKYAFEGCGELKSVIIPNSVESIGEGAFSYCLGIKSVKIFGRITCIGNKIFINCINLSSITIPDSVTNIGDNAFGGCRSLKSVANIKNVTSIRDSAFYGCSSLPDITIPKGVTRITHSTFEGCSNLYAVTIPDKETNIMNCAFCGCSKLMDIIFHNIRFLEHIGQRAFEDCPIRELFIPWHTKIEKKSFNKNTIVKRIKVFISYSWDNEEHIKRVKNFANDLDKHGIHVTLDKKTLHTGDDLIAFMNKISDNETEKVICIMTPEYKRKAEQYEGGVGAEYKK